MPLSKEQLLTIRYKNIAPYPGSDWTANEIIAFEKDFQGRPVHYVWDSEGRKGFAPHFFDDYPHLFQKLVWHQDRKAEEMPEYVKWVEDGPFGKLEIANKVEKVERIEPAFGSWAIKVPSQVNGIRPEYFVPASPEEYRQYLLSQNTK